MKNKRLESMLRSSKTRGDISIEVLTPEEEGSIKGGTACFTCQPKFKCRNGFSISIEDAL